MKIESMGFANHSNYLLLSVSFLIWEHSKPDQGDGVTWSDHAWDKVYCSSMTKRNGMCFSKQ